VEDIVYEYLDYWAETTRPDMTGIVDGVRGMPSPHHDVVGAASGKDRDASHQGAKPPAGRVVADTPEKRKRVTKHKFMWLKQCRIHPTVRRSANALGLAILIIDVMDSKTCCLRHGNESLMAESGLSLSRLKEALGMLREAGLIDISQGRGRNVVRYITPLLDGHNLAEEPDDNQQG
jgi:hypothetical protein